MQDAFAAAVEKARSATGLSQNKLAERLGVTGPQLSDMLAGRRAVPNRVHLALLDITEPSQRERERYAYRVLGGKSLQTLALAGAALLFGFGAVGDARSAPMKDGSQANRADVRYVNYWMTVA